PGWPASGWRCSGMQFRELDGATLLNVPLITCEAVEGIQVRQPAKSWCSTKKLHRPSAVEATRSFRRGHDTISNVSAHVVREHYRRVAGSLTFGKMSLGQ